MRLRKNMGNSSTTLRKDATKSLRGRGARWTATGQLVNIVLAHLILIGIGFVLMLVEWRYETVLFVLAVMLAAFLLRGL